MSRTPVKTPRAEGSVPQAWFAWAAITAAVVLCYANSLSGPLVFDDRPSIETNASIRQLWPLASAFSPPAGEGLTVEGRPMVNFSLALNYAWSGTGVGSYHALNILIHLGSALLLFGVVRRTLRLSEEGASTFSTRADYLAFAIALLWAVHPLQTESVTYIVQRAESLMAFFYLLTLYGLVRGGGPENRRGWLVTSVVACALGMATKEVTVSAPVIALCFDRTFLSRSFRDAWRQRSGYYIALASTWIILGWLVLGSGTRGGTAGFGINVKWWVYALTQFQAIAHYLWLSFWPTPLIFDYGTQWVSGAGDVVPYALIIFGLVVATLWLFARKHPAGFLGLFFFAILAPTSSIVPGNRQTLAEHRMYLPLALVISLVTCGSSAWSARRTNAPSRQRWNRIFATSALVVSVVFIGLTITRNRVYRSELLLLRDTVAKRPRNGFARYNFGKALAESGSPGEAVEQYEAALRLIPDTAYIYYNLGNALVEAGELARGEESYRAAVRLQPSYLNAYYNLGTTLARSGKPAEAAESFRRVLVLQPDHLEARDNLGSTLLEMGRLDEAEGEYRQVLAANPRLIEARCNLGAVHYLQHRFAESAADYAEALKIDPQFAPARVGLERAQNAR